MHAAPAASARQKEKQDDILENPGSIKLPCGRIPNDRQVERRLRQMLTRSKFNTETFVVVNNKCGQQQKPTYMDPTI
ncbi:hypothetical protein T265_09771 [Opisthorchis viverrini]|uniref:Uncharacterized protein n=1 Tax=Opisthorchis viverrini TaxID=6198 RepID=A0A074ZRN2_OPIVI|nr:hypothetical protein T265_09771 [Opisthorchis viverrini]XP_009178274.1 hypothetical protein T265_12411 [Opisthorchis viverrini]KER17979.1 hypothetical protein T265_12411 [Opisthorchis viverrini]KER22058.1 hypothetical protein T265_09771 [Opisthorchis viverrini]